MSLGRSARNNTAPSEKIPARLSAPPYDSQHWRENSPRRIRGDAKALMGDIELLTHFVLVREVGDKRWLYLDGKGGEVSVRIRAGRYPEKLAKEIARNIEKDNNGTWEAKAVSV